MRVAIYARFSSDLQSASSVDDQVRLYRERGEVQHWVIEGLYADRGLRGSSQFWPE